MKFATTGMFSSIYMSRTPFSKIPDYVPNDPLGNEIYSALLLLPPGPTDLKFGRECHGSHLENLFCASSPFITCRSKIHAYQSLSYETADKKRNP